MTKRERAQVVELLRCAADVIASTGDPWGARAEAWRALGHDRNVSLLSGRAETDCVVTFVANADERIARLLEAAQRVEDGEWP